MSQGDCSGSQETEFRSQNGNTIAANMRNGLATRKREKEIHSASQAILNSGF